VSFGFSWTSYILSNGLIDGNPAPLIMINDIALILAEELGIVLCSIISGTSRGGVWRSS